MKINVLLIIYFLGFSWCAFSQQKLTVLDRAGSEPMPFVKIFPNVGRPFFTNIDGEAFIADSITSINLSFTGYYDTIIQVESQQELTVYMQEITKEFNEVVILPGVNPALRIINNTIANRKYNNPLKNDAFTYKSYSKFIFDMDSAFTRKVMSMPSDTSREMIELIKTQHIFMMESASERAFIPPSRDRENITAYKISGLKNPLFSTFAQSMQSFHFYDNKFTLVMNEYLSPIAFGAPKKYYYILEDTTITGQDTTFMISFRPRPEIKLNCLKGFLFINTNGFAVEKVIAEPANDTSGTTQVTIIQEYKLIDGKKWFPINLKTKAELKGFQMTMRDSINNDTLRGYVIGNGSTYISDIQINPDSLRKRGFNNIALATEVGAGKTTQNEWQAIRKDSLTEKEKRTYVVVDSLSEEFGLNKKINGLMTIFTGKIRLGYFNLPLNRIVDFNFHEGYRIGAGLENSNLLMKNIVVGGYFAYGMRDKDWKYGAYSKFFLNKRLGMSIGLRYQQDVINRGNNVLSSNSWDLRSSSVLTNFFRKFMDRQRLAEVNFTIAPLGNLTMHFLANYQRVEFTRNYRFTDQNNLIYSKLDLAETAFEMKWNIGQRIIVLGDIRLPQPTKFPKIELKVAKGWKNIFNSQADYLRLYVAANEDLSSMRFGKLHLHLEASQTFGDVPLLLKQYTTGTRQDWNTVTVDALETAFPGEFYHDRQAVFISRYSFPIIKTKAKWFAPEFILHHGIGYGDMSNKAAHNMQFWTMDKGFFEGGLVVSGLLNVQFIQLGVGAFYRYGYYSKTNALDNLVPKISIKIAGF